jgi:hypothetical protein
MQSSVRIERRCTSPILLSSILRTVANIVKQAYLIRKARYASSLLSARASRDRSFSLAAELLLNKAGGGVGAGTGAGGMAAKEKDLAQEPEEA